MDPSGITHYLPAVRLADGGVVRAVLDGCRIMAMRGHRILLLTYDAADVPPQWLSSAAGMPSVVSLDRPGKSGFLPHSAMAQARAAVRKTDVLHLHGPWIPGNLQLAAVARRIGKPYVLSIHGMLDDWAMAQRSWKKRLFLLLAGSRFIRRAARIHLTAEEERRQASRWIGQAATIVLPPLFDLDPYRHLAGPELAVRQFSITIGKPTVLFLSRLHPKKGIDILIDAVAELRRRGQEVRLLIAGVGEPAYEAALFGQVARLKLEDRIQFLGQVGGEAKLSLFQAVDLMALPTSQENFGLALIEAAACGKPLVTTRGVDLYQELESAGAIIVERSPAAFADAIQQLLNAPEERSRRGSTLRQWVFQSLDPQAVAEKYEAMYRSIVTA
jgi:glycosyltransferase involved in cell wall biosynthesis